MSPQQTEAIQHRDKSETRTELAQTERGASFVQYRKENSGASFEKLALNILARKTHSGAEDSSDTQRHLCDEVGVKVLVRYPSLRFQFGTEGFQDAWQQRKLAFY